MAKKFTCTEKRLVVRDPSTRQTIAVMTEGDSLTLDDALVKAYCERGWGTADGETTGTRKPGNMPLGLTKSAQKAKPAPTPKA